MKIITFITEKGGTGKTTGAREVGGVLAKDYNKKVLFIDCDYQRNLSTSFGVEDNGQNIFNAFLNKNFRDNIVNIDKNMDIIPGSIDMKDLDVTVRVSFDKDDILKNELNKLEYDYIIIDCRPDMKLIEKNALRVSNFVLTPIEPHYFSLDGFDLVERFIAGTQEDLSTPFTHLSYLSRVPGDKVFMKELEPILEQYSDSLLKTCVKENVKLKEASMYKVLIVDYSPTSNGAKDFRALVKELIEYGI